MSEQTIQWFDSPRLRRRSHSSFQNQCPRKAMLTALTGDREDGTVHTEFGSAYGCGAQALMQGKSLEEAIWEGFLAFDGDFEELQDKRSRKSFWEAVDAIERFGIMWEAVGNPEYELLYFTDQHGNSVPAVELSFRLDFADGYYFIGYIDAVLRNRSTGELVVLELKTTSDHNVPEAKYKNSNQALGYGIVLDYFADLIGANGSSYTVLYLVYGTKEQSFSVFPFPKTALDRVDWLRDTATKFAFWNHYIKERHFPKNGDVCFNFNRVCNFFGMCDTDPAILVNAEHIKGFGGNEETAYHVRISYEELVARQKRVLENAKFSM